MHCKLIVTLLTASICLSINWHHGYAWQINDFTVDIRVHSDSHITVTERITVDFGYERRHGIYRVIPYKYQRSADMLLGKGGMRLSYNLRIKVRSVTDALGNGRPYRVRRWGGNINIRIGHPKRYVSGVQVYVITYDVWRALNKFPDHVELYWNATGNEWSAYIYSATARVRLPLAVNPLNTQTVAATFYTGPYGSRKRLGTMHRTSEYIVFKTSNLPPQNGLTIVVGFPANAVVFPSRARELLWMLQDNWRWLMPFMLPLIALGMMLTLWYAYGRDPLRHLPIMVQYEPPEGLSPAEVGTLIDESADVSDIVATVVDLAVRGYLKIRELPSAKFLFFTERDYEFVLLKDYERAFARWRAWKGVKRKRSDTTESKNEGNSSDDWDMLAEHEYLFLHGMFGASVDNIVRLSDLKNRFYVHLDRVIRAVYRELTISKRLFAMNPKNVRVIFRSIAMMLWFAGFLSLTISWLGAPFAIGLGIAGGVVWLLAPLMPRKTRRGAQVARHILGFKEFIERVEKDRIERMAKEDPTLFDRVLPYAIVLGVADEWAEKFRDLLREPPSWYESTDWAVAPFYAPRFIHEFGRGLHTMGSTFTSAPSGKGAGGGFSGFGGGGGGFSGGGFGGGGGGAW